MDMVFKDMELIWCDGHYNHNAVKYIIIFCVVFIILVFTLLQLVDSSEDSRSKLN